MRKLVFFLVFYKMLFASNDSLYVDMEISPMISQHGFLFPGIVELYKIPHIDEIKYEANFRNYLYATTSINIKFRNFYSNIRIMIPNTLLSIANFNKLSEIKNKDGSIRYFWGSTNFKDKFLTNIPRKIRETPQKNFYLDLHLNTYRNIIVGIWYESGGTKITEEGVANPTGLLVFDSLKIGIQHIKNQLMGFLFKINTIKKNWKGEISLNLAFEGNYKIKYENYELLSIRTISKKMNLKAFDIGFQLYWKNFYFKYAYKKIWAEDNLFTDTFLNLFLGIRINLVKMKFIFSEL